MFQHIKPVVVAFIHKVKSGKEYPTLEEWQRITTLVTTHHPNMEEIRNRRDISPQEYRVCVLLKLGLSVSDIVLAENITNANLTNMRRRLMKKLFGVGGSTKDFDRRLREM